MSCRKYLYIRKSFILVVLIIFLFFTFCSWGQSVSNCVDHGDGGYTEIKRESDISAKARNRGGIPPYLKHFNGYGYIAGYTWSPDSPPTGRNAPYISEYNDKYVLKINKYMEGYVDLVQGNNNSLQLSGPMTLTAVIQLAKQWPMDAGLISKWGFMEGGSSYELGITLKRKVFFQISEDGRYDGNVVRIETNKSIDYEKPLAICATYEPGKKMVLYINGRKEKQLLTDVPTRSFDGDSHVKIGSRFEGLIGGIWFHDKALSDKQVRVWSEAVSKSIPRGTKYSQWKRLKRNVPRNEPDFLNTTKGMKLLKEVDISKYSGSYLCPGDLNNDGRIDFLLYKNASSYTMPGRLIALDNNGNLLWTFGDNSLKVHTKSGKADVGKPGTTPALRGIATVFDIDQDGKTEVISELWENEKPMLYIIDGSDGNVKHCIDSPIDMSIRQPLVKGNRQPTRSHPVVRIAWLNGKNEQPSIILKYGASNDIVCHAFALDSNLNTMWHIEGTKHSMGHIPTVSDVDEDGLDEIILGHMLVDNDGTVIWDKGYEFEWHADATSSAQVLPSHGKEIFISVCGIGPLYCLSARGDILWSPSREQVEHGQALWVANFTDKNPGMEVISLASGHVGVFYTFDAATGKTLAKFEHRRLLPSYPDFPTIVNWKSIAEQSLWLPQDRILVDGYGNVVAELGDKDQYVQKKLNCGTSWRPVGAQAFALDLFGDQRDEMILYEPYQGESVFIFSNPDSSAVPKPYKAQKNAYNIRSYF